MSRVLIIGAGGVGGVVAHKCAQVPEVFSEIVLASRTVEKCYQIEKSVLEKYPKTKIMPAELDADDVRNVVMMIKYAHADLVINVALPYQDLSIMDACLATGVHYLDTANYEPRDTAKFEYSWQWAYHGRFKDKGIMALLGCGFDPGVTNVFTAYAAKHHFDEIHELDIRDCNGGDHGRTFATNFNLEINIREVTQPPRFWQNGEWVERLPILNHMCTHRPDYYEEIGKRESYLLYHEELESLVKNFPTLRRAKFWMTFGEQYLNHLRVLDNVGMTRIDPVMYQGQEIIPLQFLKAIMPEPSSLGENYKGKTNIGCDIKGLKDGKKKTYRIYNVCDHEECFREVGAQAISYTTGVPAMIGAMMILTGQWRRPGGVFNVEEFNPDPFMEKLGQYGLPWTEKFMD